MTGELNVYYQLNSISIRCHNYEHPRNHD